jgi:adenine-specific DNA-methyltransferase
MAKEKKTKRTPVESIKHRDKRANIPTEELRDFVSEDEAQPKQLLYPRDPSLDPQLVWKGKDDQDKNDLSVPIVPIYIQEKIHPQALIEDFRAHAAVKEHAVAAKQTGFQSTLFGDFNGIDDDFARKVDFYSHETQSQPRWSNRVILGDSLLVMTSLAEKEGLRGKVQMIYLDPPYGIKFGSNWQVSTRKREVKDGKVEDATRQPEQIRAFRDTWKLGVHSYLAYLRDRFRIAHELLTKSGSVFVQIGDENVHLVRALIDEVFGSENFIAQISFAKTSGYATNFLTGICDYILWYGKDREQTKYRQLNSPKEAGEAGASKYTRIMLPNGETRSLTAAERSGEVKVPPGSRFWVDDNLTSQGNPFYAFTYSGKEYSGTYKTTPSGLAKLALANRLYAAEGSLRYIRFIDDFPAVPLNAAWMDIGGIQSRVDPKIYVVQTAVEAVKRCILMTTDSGDLVLDPTCGSGTTAVVAEQCGRRWITIDTSRVAIALARTRLMAAKFPYYLLSDSPEGINKEAELTGRMPPEYKTDGDIKKGFVYKRVPHVTLKSIANNPDINEGMTREEIEFAIARHADTELLYDQPYEDNKRIRVTGPFTVESLSPHRVLAADENMDGTVSTQEAQRQQDFASMILDNLKKAGVQNTRKQERLVFDSLEPYAGSWINAVGTFTDTDGKVKRVAISIGPEHGTVGPQQVKEAAKEAVQGIGFDLLVVCGFAFDPHVAEEAKRYGKLTVLPTRMNPDLAMGDELLKKTGAGNLFMVFGEPDVDIRESEDGKITVKIKGLDIYDPTTGEIRSSSTDDLACWFIDTDYNGESFFVRHAYFLGADEPYENLRRALRAEIDESAWSALYKTTSRPFDPPKTGKIAIKVINHYGDEVLKIYEVGV